MPIFSADPANDLLALWPLWLPLVAGGVTIYLLLPRPKAPPVLWGILAGVATLVLAGGLLVRAGTFSAEVFLFYTFSGLALASGGVLVTQSNPARAALSFALVVLSSCGLFLLLAAPFMMAATTIVYAGAIVVTFLFVIMLAQQSGMSDADARSREPLLATVTGFVLLGVLLYSLHLGYKSRELDRLLGELRQAKEITSKEKLNDAIGDMSSDDFMFTRARKYLVSQGWTDLAKRTEEPDRRWLEASSLPDNEGFEDSQKILTEFEQILLEGQSRLGRVNVPSYVELSPLSGPPANLPADEIRRDPNTLRPEVPAENSAYLGRSLFTDFLLPVELGGTLLLVATIGAIAIAQRRLDPDQPTPPGPEADGLVETK